MNIVSAISGVVGLVKFLWRVLAIWKKAKAEGWLAEADLTLQKIEGAKSDEERKALARRLAKAGMFPPT